MSSEVADGAVELSIGEVLELLQEDFPDVTISKIRFLESQGLIQPGRTASGYRRFNAADVDRLRWILHQQRDHFLPLKVIRQMLDDEVDRYVDPDPAQPTLWSRTDPFPVAEDGEQDDEQDGEQDGDGSGTGAARTRDGGVGGAGSAVPTGGTAVTHDPAVTRDPADTGDGVGATGSAPDGGRPARRPVAPTQRRTFETPADVVAALQEDPRPRTPRRGDRPALWADRPVADQPTMSAEELCAAGGIDAELLADLERFGLVRAAQRAGETFYGPSALEVAQLASRAAVHGISARHLRMYLVSAEREAGFIEQLTVPLLKQRNPESRSAAVSLSGELASLGADLHAALLRRELGPVLGDTP